jgi:hypothetical protein
MASRGEERSGPGAGSRSIQRSGRIALDQLQWAVNYLYRIRKPTLAAGLDKNRKQILGELDAIARKG